MSKVLSLEMPCLINQTVRAKPLAVTKNRSLHYVLGISLFFAFCIQLWVRVEITKQGYELEQLRGAMKESDLELAQVKLKYARYQRPQALASVAQRKLSMVALKRENIRRIGVE